MSKHTFLKKKIVSKRNISILILIVSLLFFALVFPKSVIAATDYNLHGWNSTDWIAIKVDSNGMLEMSANVSSVSWNNILDMPSGFLDNLDDVASLNPWAQGANIIYNDSADIKVGIGTSSPLDTLHIFGNVTITENLTVNYNITSQDSLLTNYIFPNTLTTINLDNITVLKDLHVLGNSYLGSFSIENDLIIGSNNISSTYLGLGTLSPNYLLHLYESSSANNTNSNLLVLERANNTDDPIADNFASSILFRLPDDTNEIENISMISSIFTDVSNSTERTALAFYTGYGDVNGIISNLSQSEAMRITADGKVGIGTSSPLTTLNVYGTGNFSDNLTVDSDLIASNLYSSNSIVLSNVDLSTLINNSYARLDSFNIFNNLNHFSSNVSFADNLTVGSALYVDSSSGRVGIGTTNPDQNLVVSDGANSHVNIVCDDDDNEAAGCNATLRFWTDGVSYKGKIGWEQSIDKVVLGYGDDNDIVIASSGNVGIGTTSPTGAIGGTVALHLNNTGGSGEITIESVPTSDSYLSFSNGSLGGFVYYDVSQQVMALIGTAGVGVSFKTDNSDTQKMTIDTGGNILMPSLQTTGEDVAACFIASSGELIEDAATTCTSSSIRYKSNVRPIEYGLNEVLQLNPISFTHNRERGREAMGLIAEDVEKVIPELVVYQDGQVETLEYYDFTGLFVKAIQEQQEQIDELRQHNRELEEEMKKLRQVINDTG